jgi:hypothetical protein
MPNPDQPERWIVTGTVNGVANVQYGLEFDTGDVGTDPNRLIDWGNGNYSFGNGLTYNAANATGLNYSATTTGDNAFVFDLMFDFADPDVQDPPPLSDLRYPAPYLFTANGGSYVPITPLTHLGADPNDVAKTALFLYGTVGNDTITLGPGDSLGSVAVTLDGISLGSYSLDGGIYVDGSGGTDQYSVTFGSNLIAPIIIAGTSTDSLTVNGSLDPSAPNYITKNYSQGQTRVTWGPSQSQTVETVTYTGLPATSIINGGAGSNFYNDPGTNTIINGGPADNTFLISGTIGSGVVLNGGPTSNTYVIDLGSLDGPVSITNSNPTAVDNLVVNGADGDNTIIASGSQVTAGTQTINLNAPLASATINGGSGDNQIAIAALDQPVQNLIVNGGTGNDLVTLADVGGTVAAVTVNGGSTTGDNQLVVQGTAPTQIAVTRLTPTLTLTGGSFAYNGAAHPAVASLLGFDGSSLGTPTITYTDAAGHPVAQPVDVGTYTATASFAGNDQYNAASATAIVTIGPASLGIIATSTLMLAGANPPALTGFVNGTRFSDSLAYTTPQGDSVTVTLSSPATAASPVGQYDITASLSGAKIADYFIDPATSRFGKVYVVTLGADPSSTTGAQAVTFWDNKGNAKLITAADLTSLDALNLVTQGGSAFDPKSVQQLQSWLSISPNATAAYQLAVQLAAMDLNVLTGYVKTSDLVYAGQLLPYATADAITGLTTGGFIDVQDLMNAANAVLAQVKPGTPSGDPNQAYEAALTQVFQAANANTDFVKQEVLWNLTALDLAFILGL